MFLSIISPVFNSYKLMENYFSFFEKQEYKDFELLIIDDHSTDSSYKDLMSIKDKYNLNIKILQTLRNSGPGEARNIGLQQAKGEYVTFVDSDDYVDSTFTKTLYDLIINKHYDIVVFDRYKVKGNKKTISNAFIDLNEGVVQKDEALIKLVNYGAGLMYSSNLISKNKISFPQIRRNEDVTFSALAIYSANDIYYLKKPLYYYVQYKQSLSKNKNLSGQDMQIAFSLIEEKITSKELNAALESKSIRDLLYGVVLMMAKSKTSSKSIRKYIKEYQDKYSNWYHDYEIKKMGMYKRLFLGFIRFRFILGIRLLAYIHSILI